MNDQRTTIAGLSRGNWITILVVIVPLTLTGVYVSAQGTKQIEINTNNDIILNAKIDAVRKEIKGDFKNLETKLIGIVDKQNEYRRQDMKEIRGLIEGLK